MGMTLKEIRRKESFGFTGREKNSFKILELPYFFVV
jgi:hypothetical protein